MKGRKPKLFAVSEAEGDTGHRQRIPPPAPSGDFDPPFELSDVARAEWDRIRAEAPWIRASSGLVLALRCEMFADLMNARKDIKRRGRLLTTRNGKVKNPSLQIEREAAVFILRADVELGLTSCSEQKVAVPKGPAVDSLESALCG